MSGGALTRGEQVDLQKLARMRAKVARNQIDAVKAERLAEFHEENATPVVGLRERAWIRIEGPRGWLGGERGACIFRRGSAPEERATGATLDDLLV